jgi:hypothetical protein
VIFTINPCFMPTLKRRFHGEVKEATPGAGLESHALNNLSFVGTCLVF